MAHPPTYLNKVLIGGADGSMQLRNIKSDALLYTFSLQSRVCCIEASPALDVVGVGLADGSAVLLNVKFDEQVLKFENAAGAGIGGPASTASGAPSSSQATPCTCLAFRCVRWAVMLQVLHATALEERPQHCMRSFVFRTGAGLPLLAAGGAAGVLTIWDLEENKLRTMLRDAHRGPVCTLKFFTGALPPSHVLPARRLCTVRSVLGVLGYPGNVPRIPHEHHSKRVRVTCLARFTYLASET